MNKDNKRKAALEARKKFESLRFQTMYGAKQRLDEISQETETRIESELTVFKELDLVEDLLKLKTATTAIKQELGISPNASASASSMVAYCLGIEPECPLEKTFNIIPANTHLPLHLIVSYDDESRNRIVTWLKENGYQLSTYFGQPLLKLTNIRVIFRREIKDK